MKIIRYLFILIGTNVPISINSQHKNSLSIQTGIIHNFFDGNDLFKGKAFYPANFKLFTIDDLLAFQNMFGGYLNDSFGFQYERELTPKSFISIEKMFYRGSFRKLGDFNNYTGPPALLLHKFFNTINITYSRKIKFFKTVDFTYGLGINFREGEESYLLSNLYNLIYYEAEIITAYGKDFALNARIGRAYNVSKRFTLFTNIDFQRILNNESYFGHYNKYNYYNKFNLDELPSKYDLSFRLGLSYHFGEKIEAKIINKIKQLKQKKVAYYSNN